MSRWSPNARGRLQEAAHDLFLERGYEQTTVADIAERAELTERTFFRHFLDKREVLFGGSVLLQDELRRAVAEAPADLATIEAVRTAVEAVSRLMAGRRAIARELERLIAAHADLRERSLIKRATLTSTLADALKQRGVSEPSASLAADMGMTVFYVGFRRWLEDTSERELEDIVREGFAQLKAVASGN